MLERVYAVDGYYDGPEVGYADYRGLPHRFEVDDEWETEESRVRIFKLYRISNEHLCVVLEAHLLWARWNEKYRRGELRETLPGEKDERVLPEDREAYEFLTDRQAKFVEMERGEYVLLQGDFVPGGIETEYKAFCETSLVKWQEASGRVA